MLAEKQVAQVRELAEWALREGDTDVAAVCSRALLGDTTALEEALDWYDAWSSIHRSGAEVPASEPRGYGARRR